MTENARLAVLLHEVKTFAMEIPLSIEYTELTLADVKFVFVDSLDQLVTTTIGCINATQPQSSGPLRESNVQSFLVLRRNIENGKYGGKVYCGPVS